jgi:GT2 family glycosyltransferase
MAFEVIVVDNASKDGTREMIAKDFPDIRYLYNPQNTGFTRGNNQGIRISRGKYVLLLNSDTKVVDNALSRMVQFMEDNPDCGIMGCKLLNPDGSIQYSCRRFPSYQTAFFNRYSILTRLFPQNRFSQSYLMSSFDHNQTREVDWVSGAALLARRKAFEEVGILDETFTSYSEDVDWCYRMHEAGWRVCFYPEARIVHYIGQTTRQHLVRYIIIRHVSMYQFYRKHYSRSIKSIDYLVLLGIGLRSIWAVCCGVLRLVFRQKKAV